MEDYYLELARRLFAAVVSVQMGIGLQYAYNTHCKGKIDESWIELAKAISATDK